jgi:hypothetical protein
MCKGVLGLVFFFAVAIISRVGLLYREVFRDFLNTRLGFLDPSQSQRERLEFEEYWNDLTAEEREELISAADNSLGKQDEQEV